MFTRCLAIIVLALFQVAIPAYGDEASQTNAQKIEQGFQAYSQKMASMANNCRDKSPTTKMICVCRYLKDLVAFRTLIHQAALSTPDEVVTFQTQSKSETITIGALAKQIQKTETFDAMCKSPAQTGIELTKLKIKTKWIYAQTTLQKIRAHQDAYKRKHGRFAAFKPVGQAIQSCQVKDLAFTVPSCQSADYIFSAIVTSDGGFISEARTDIGDNHPLFPGCETPDVWTINDAGRIRHLIDASKQCRP